MKFLKATLIEIIDGRIAQAEKELADAKVKHKQEVEEAEQAHKDFLRSVNGEELLKQFMNWFDHRGYRSSYVYTSRTNGNAGFTPEYMMQAAELPSIPGEFNARQYNEYIALLKSDKRMLELSDGPTVTINSVNSKFGVYLS